MNKIFIIIRQEFLNRVRKRSFLIATILLPLIFPLIVGVLVYIAVEQKKSAEKELILYVDEGNIFVPDTSQFIFHKTESIESAKEAVRSGACFGALYIPEIDLFNPSGILFYTKNNVPPSDKGHIEWMISTQIRELKIQQLNLDTKVLDRIKTDISIETLTFSEEGKERSSNANVLFGVGMTSGILMYMFIFIYGMQIMQGIIEEKNSKVVEIIVSSVRPFQLMMGKIMGLASVGLLQFLIWILLISTLSALVLSLFGIQMPQQEMAEQMSRQLQEGSAQNPAAMQFIKTWSEIPFGHVALSFLFYFLGGYLIYGALFAAVGASVDSPAEAQQFTFPITIPLLISYMSLFIFVLDDPHGTISVWLSIIPFTSPIAMMGRIAFNPPLWQEILSMVLLIAGYIFTAWVAGRIYRVGILMHGSKVNYKVLAKWFMMRG